MLARVAGAVVVLAVAVGIGIAAAGALSGCAAGGVFAQSFVRGKVKAQYTLEDRPTLVLVDDPSNLLGDPTLANEVAYQVGVELQEFKALKRVVPPLGVYELAARWGQDYRRAAIDRVGRELGAEQVIYVFVDRAVLSPEPGLLRPAAAVRVKVVDTGTGKRLFPAVGVDASTPQLDHVRVNSSLSQPAPDDGSQETTNVYRLKLARRVARDVARLFHDYVPRQPGDPLED